VHFWPAVVPEATSRRRPLGPIPARALHQP
jgi:hypothetical protein